MIDFRQVDALLVIDVLDAFDHDEAERLLASFRDRGEAMARAIETAREAGVPVVYVNDDRDRWDSDAPALAREAVDGPGGDVIRELLPRSGDHVLLEHRYSAFDPHRARPAPRVEGHRARRGHRRGDRGERRAKRRSTHASMG